MPLKSDIKKLTELDVTNSFAVVRDDDISLLDFWLLILESKKLILLVVSICVLIGVSIAYLSTPLYRAEVLMVPVSDGVNRGGALNGQFGELASLAGVTIPISSGGKVDEAVAVLMSREFTYRFFEEQDMLPQLFKSRWDARTGAWKKGKEVPTLWDAYKLFDKKIRKINIDKKTRHVMLSITWKDPLLAATWANIIVKRLNKELREYAIKQTSNNLSYLRKQLIGTSVLELQKSIYNLMEVEMKKSMIANSGDEYIFHVIDKAVLPEEKITPRRWMIIFVSVLIGFFMAAVFVFTKAIYSDNKHKAD